MKSVLQIRDTGLGRMRIRSRDPGWGKSVSGFNIPDPQHCSKSFTKARRTYRGISFVFSSYISCTEKIVFRKSLLTFRKQKLGFDKMTYLYFAKSNYFLYNFIHFTCTITSLKLLPGTLLF